MMHVSGVVQASDMLSKIFLFSSLLLLVDSRASNELSERENKALTVEAGTLWKSITDPILSNDGAWIAYNLTSFDDSAELVVRSVKSPIEFRVPRGSGQESDTINEDTRRSIEFTADSRSLLFTVTSSTGKVRLSKMSDQAAGAARQSALAILSLPSGRISEVPGVMDFVLSRGTGRHVAFYRDHQSAESSSAGSAKVLVLREIETAKELNIPHVSEFAFDVAGRYLAYAVSSANSRSNGAYVRNVATGQVRALLSGPGAYVSLTFDRGGGQLAFLSDYGDSNKSAPRFSVYLAQLPSLAVAPVVKSNNIFYALRIAPEAGVRFTSRGNALTFELKPLSEAVSTEADSQKADVELWHWKATNPEGEKYLKAHKPGYLSVYHIAARQWVQLGRDSIPRVLLSDNARYALGFDKQPYLLEPHSTVDVYLINTSSGHVTLFRRGFSFGEPASSGPFVLSPGGRYLIYFENRRWFSYDLARGKLADLTGQLLPDVHFEMNNGRHRIPMAIGLAGWTAEGSRALIYDQHDIWDADLSGERPPRNVTTGLGRKVQTVFRIWPDDYRSYLYLNWSRAELPQVDSRKPLLLTALNQDTGEIGVWRLPGGTGAIPAPVLSGEAQITLLTKAAQAEQYLLTRQSFSEFPDLWTGTRLDRLQKASDANPQQGEYRWGSVELIGWTSDSGVPLKGLLYKPQGFDPSKRYPMIIQIYDAAKNGSVANDRYTYQSPVPIGNAQPTPLTFLSRGYLFFRPDLAFTSPYRREGAVAAVVSGVESVVDRAFVDPARIGLVGHSMGGFMVNSVVTHTNLFKCAVEGAGASNAISGYADNPYLYERAQMALGASPWELPEAYLANSPILFANRVHTPLLILHNEDDVAVPFHHGREFFTALRRNHREAYMLNYRHEGHILSQKTNILDWNHRMRDFFDHCLKGAPEPEWMKIEASRPGRGVRSLILSP